MQETTQKTIEAYRQALKIYESASGKVGQLQEVRASTLAEVRRAEKAVEDAHAAAQACVSAADSNPIQIMRDLETAQNNLRVAIEASRYAKAAPTPSEEKEAHHLRQYRQLVLRALADEELQKMPKEASDVIHRAFSVLGGDSFELWGPFLEEVFKFNAISPQEKKALRNEVVTSYGLGGEL